MPAIRVIIDVVRWVMLSVALHLAVLWWLAPEEKRHAWSPPTLPRIEPQTVVELIDVPVGGGGGERRLQTRVAKSAPKRSPDAWEQVAVRTERGRNWNGNGNGNGSGNGNGNGNGIGLGTGGSVRITDDVPEPPPPPRISKARPPILIWPTRNEDVDDDSNLFVARVSLNRYGEVVGARILTRRPGAKADRAANVIWTFRYTPALDDDGMPVKATLDQEFQIR